jgi:hypothetical protein
MSKVYPYGPVKLNVDSLGCNLEYMYTPTKKTIAQAHSIRHHHFLTFFNYLLHFEGAELVQLDERDVKDVINLYDQSRRVTNERNCDNAFNNMLYCVVNYIRDDITASGDMCLVNVQTTQRCLICLRCVRHDFENDSSIEDVFKPVKPYVCKPSQEQAIYDTDMHF